MITPWFKLTQDTNFLFIHIKAAYAKISEVDIFVEDNDFRFYCKPYYLRLNLPGKIIESELPNESAGIYDFDENLFKFKFEKAVPCQHFDGLDLLTKLLTPIPVANPARVLIEEISDPACANPESDSDSESEIEWFVDQQIQETPLQTDSGSKYGFANKKCNVFSKLGDEYSLVIDLPEPDMTAESQRGILRVQDEKVKFNEDHYLADFYDDSEMIETCLLKYKPCYEDDGGYTEAEVDCLKNLPKKTFLLTKQEKCYAYCGLIDILYAYCFNRRINCGERKAVESGWNIAKMSSTLSWFESFDCLDKCVLASFRRSLCYPLYRNWELSKLVYSDLIELVKKGKLWILKSLIECRETFIDEDCRYILNDLYLNDYCVWVQYVSGKRFDKMAKCLENIDITKDMVEFDLECLEICAKSALEDKNNLASDDDDDSSESSESESEIISDLNSLKIDSNEEKLSRPKIIELD